MYCRANVERYWTHEMETTKQRLCTKTLVSLLNRKHVSVGEGYISTVKVGDVLHTRAVLEDEVAVTVTKVIDGKCAVEEPYLEYLEECMNTCIRWKIEYVVEVAANAEEELKRRGRSGGHHFDVFEWTEDDRGTRSYDDGFIRQKKEQRRVGKVPLHMESDRAPWNESNHGRGELENPIVLRKKRTYYK
jgi:hypothetical protein